MKNFALFTYRRLEYTRDQLLEFKKQIDNKGGQGQGEEQGGGFGGGFGGFGGGGGNEVNLKYLIFFTACHIVFNHQGSLFLAEEFGSLASFSSS